MKEPGGNLLIIDDQPDNLRVLSSILQGYGFTVRKALNGEMALRAIHSTKPDLILLDVCLPGIDGYEICSLLKQNYETQTIPVIFLSALDAVPNKVKGLQLGGVDYITKPYQSEEVIARIQQQLTIQHQQRQLAEQNQKLQEANRKLQEAEAALQQVNANLEQQAHARTAEIKQALEFEARLKRITDKVRDSLDEKQILQTAVQELAEGLNTVGCNAGIYSHDRTTATVACEFNHTLCSFVGQSFYLRDSSFEHVYGELLKGQYSHFSKVLIDRENNSLTYTVLACPVYIEQEVIGDLWLYRPEHQRFSDSEIRLVQQVANQCAIALRQARLYESSQAQIRELEKLNRLKDDFLSTISHELRTPVANIKMVSELLSMIIHQEPHGLAQASDSDRVRQKLQQYVHILHDECDRELRLLQDFLDLQQLEAGVVPYESVLIPNLREWLLHLVEPFEERIQKHQQHLQIELASELPTLITDAASLQRLFSELMENACKFTPADEAILIAASQQDDLLRIKIDNSGVSLSTQELSCVFNKFYRVPNNDPWKYSGTGLGLALVKHLVRHIGGGIEVENIDNIMSFTIELPINNQEC